MQQYLQEQTRLQWVCEIQLHNSSSAIEALPKDQYNFQSGVEYLQLLPSLELFLPICSYLYCPSLGLEAQLRDGIWQPSTKSITIRTMQ